MATVKVCFDNPSLSVFDGADPLFEVFSSELVTTSLACGVPVAPVKDHSLIKTDRFEDAGFGDTVFKVLELLSFDHGEHVSEGVGHVFVGWSRHRCSTHSLSPSLVEPTTRLAIHFSKS